MSEPVKAGAEAPRLPSKRDQLRERVLATMQAAAHGTYWERQWQMSDLVDLLTPWRNRAPGAADLPGPGYWTPAGPHSVINRNIAGTSP
ncbi:hypothetical protein [Devosia sp.]|uniref:hypothetical protein n=1 Tax=Devosia sp. TaxID=1871048 RepID=UPI001AD43776|nr:hypothetical protein [Devosia sp.]MBN9309004.1 hypothetical protein [Devosia sp.]